VCKDHLTLKITFGFLLSCLPLHVWLHYYKIKICSTKKEMWPCICDLFPDIRLTCKLFNLWLEMKIEYFSTYLCIMIVLVHDTSVLANSFYGRVQKYSTIFCAQLLHFVRGINKFLPEVLLWCDPMHIVGILFEWNMHELWPLCRFYII
jgi:hypothetical protein